MTKVLERPEWKHTVIEPCLLVGYLFAQTNSEMPSKHQILQLIQQVVTYFLTTIPRLEQSRVDLARKMCQLAANNDDHRPSIYQILHSRMWQGENGWKCSFEQNILVAAIHCGFESLAETMIHDGVKDSITYFGTALSCAIQHDNLHLTTLLLQKADARPTPLDLKHTAHNGNKTILDPLLEQIKDDDTDDDQDERKIIPYYVHAFEGVAIGKSPTATIHHIAQRAIS